METTIRGHATALDYHRILLDDVHRMAAYDRAIRKLVRPGDVVLDLGSGTGALAMLAARRGARVHAVESMPVAGLASALIAANGLADRITVHHCDVVTLQPVEPVDLVISDFMGRFLVDDGMLDAVAAAAAWLRPGGRFCPRRLTLRLAPVGDFPVPMVDRWREPLLGLDLSAALRPALSTCYAAQLGQSALLGPAAAYHELEPPSPCPPFDRTLALPITRDGELRGLAGWFDAELADDVLLSTEPGVVTHWGQYLFPLAPVRVRAGSVVEVRLWLAGDDWCWEGTVAGEPFDHRSHQDLAVPVVQRLPAQGRERVCAASRRGGAAFSEGDLELAHRAFLDGVAALTPEDDDLAAETYENLGISALNTGRPGQAALCFLRALDGRPDGREQSRQLLLRALVALGHLRLDG